MVEAPSYWVVYTFGTEFADDFHLRGLFTREADAKEFAEQLAIRTFVCRKPHGEVVEDIATHYITHATKVLTAVA